MDFSSIKIDYTRYPDVDSQVQHLKSRAKNLRLFLQGEPGDLRYDEVLHRIMLLNEYCQMLAKTKTPEMTVSRTATKPRLFGFIKR